MHQDQTDLVDLLAINLRSNFKLLILRYQTQLYGFALRQTGNAQEAEDIVQEAFIQAYYAVADYPIERIKALALQPWLYKITLNVFYKHLRDHKIHQASLNIEDEEYMMLAESHTSQPDFLFEGQELRQELNVLISHLPLRYREVVNLYYFSEMSYREIAELLQQPLGTIKSNLHRGISLLRKSCTPSTKGDHGWNR